MTNGTFQKCSQMYGTKSNLITPTPVTADLITAQCCEDYISLLDGECGEVFGVSGLC